MFKKDTFVVYGKTGVCRVADCMKMSFTGAAEAEYYLLHPNRDPDSCVYVPCDNERLMARMRPLLNKREIDDLLRGAQLDEVRWIEDKNERLLFFRDILSQGDRCQLVCLTRCLLNEQKERASSGKKLSSADETILKECVRMVEDEFSVALDIKPEQVGAYIRKALDDEE